MPTAERDNLRAARVLVRPAQPLTGQDCASRPPASITAQPRCTAVVAQAISFCRLGRADFRQGSTSSDCSGTARIIPNRLPARGSAEDGDGPAPGDVLGASVTRPRSSGRSTRWPSPASTSPSRWTCGRWSGAAGGNPSGTAPGGGWRRGSWTPRRRGRWCPTSCSPGPPRRRSSRWSGSCPAATCTSCSPRATWPGNCPRTGRSRSSTPTRSATRRFVDDLVRFGRDAPRPFGEMFWGLHDAAEVLPAWAQVVGADHVHVVTVPPRSAPAELFWERFAGTVGLDASAIRPVESDINRGPGRRGGRTAAAAEPPRPARRPAHLDVRRADPAGAGGVDPRAAGPGSGRSRCPRSTATG